MKTLLIEITVSVLLLMIMFNLFVYTDSVLMTLIVLPAMAYWGFKAIYCAVLIKQETLDEWLS